MVSNFFLFNLFHFHKNFKFYFEIDFFPKPHVTFKIFSLQLFSSPSEEEKEANSKRNSKTCLRLLNKIRNYF